MRIVWLRHGSGIQAGQEGSVLTSVEATSNGCFGILLVGLCASAAPSNEIIINGFNVFLGDPFLAYAFNLSVQKSVISNNMFILTC